MAENYINELSNWLQAQYFSCVANLLPPRAGSNPRSSCPSIIPVVQQLTIIFNFVFYNIFFHIRNFHRILPVDKLIKGSTVREPGAAHLDVLLQAKVFDL